LLLIPDPRPLDQRLGRKFFRQAPRRPGVYLMKDSGDNVLYVGKAKNLKQRLNNYRVANPERMPHRHLRMVTEVRRIEFQLCVTESAALEREAKLLRSLKPKFNRTGVWPSKTRFVAWRVREDHLALAPNTGYYFCLSGSWTGTGNWFVTDGNGNASLGYAVTLASPGMAPAAYSVVAYPTDVVELSSK
jgi:predicted GIY-YIG superfamily endonuclease